MAKAQGASLFRRVTRYPVSSLTDPRENRLTEVLAGVLNDPSTSGLAEAVVGYWIGQAEVSKASIETQKYCSDAKGRSGFIDLLVTSSFGSGAEVQRIAVEVKHGAPVTGDQLSLYSRVADCVVLLATRAEHESLEASGEVRRVTWEDTAAVIKDFSPRTEVGEWLQNQLIKYLGEESLMDPDPLTTTDIQLLDEHSAIAHAEKSLSEVVLRAHRKLLDRGWLDRLSQWSGARTSIKGVGAWAQLTREDLPDRNEPWIEFKLTTIEAIDSDDPGLPESGAVLIAGLSTKSQPFDSSELPSAGHADGASAYFHFSEDECSRFMKVRPLIGLLGNFKTLDEQSEAMADWVDEVCSEIADYQQRT